MDSPRSSKLCWDVLLVTQVVVWLWLWLGLGLNDVGLLEEVLLTSQQLMHSNRYVTECSTDEEEDDDDDDDGDEDDENGWLLLE